MTPTTIILLAVLSTSIASDLFSIVSESEVDINTIPACQDKADKTCIVIDIDFDALQEALEGNSITLIDGLELSNMVSPNDGSATFSDDQGNTATFTWRQRGNNTKLVGNINLADGRDFTLEPCRESHGCHVLIEESENNWGNGEEDSKAVEVLEEEMRYAVINRRTADPVKIQQGKDDSTTIVTYSIMFYYTPEFAATTEDIPLFVDQVIAETNQGYINSDVPVRVSVHCIEAATLHDIGDSGAMIDAFRGYKPMEQLLNTADGAALLVQEFSSCGIGTLGSFMYGSTVTVTMKSCALGYYSFGHEIGHNFGCMHDATQGSNSLYSYGLGKHIEGTGSRTIMAYNAPGFGPRINYWSNPNINYQGVPTGTEAENNARVIREHRFAFADIGDESSTCGSPTVTAVTPTVTATTTTQTATVTAVTPTGTATTTTQAPTPTSSYIVVTTGTCQSNGHIALTTKEECIRGSLLNNYSHSWGPHGGYADVVDGCSVRGGDALFMNPKATCKVGSPAPYWIPGLNGTANCECTSWQPCVCKINTTSGQLVSNSFPSKYQNNVDTEEAIEVEAGNTILITFTDFNIENHYACSYDYVMCYDYNDGTVLLNKTCGTTPPLPFESNTNKVGVIFHSDYSVRKTGWKLNWSMVRPSSGSFSSVNYPAAYTNDLDTEETIEVNEGKLIKISAVQFEVENGGSNCLYDWLMITDSNGDVIIPKTCGSSLPEDHTSATNKVTVTFHSDYSVTKSGYNFTWTEV